MNRQLRVFADEDELGHCVAREIVQGLETALADGRFFLVGAPSGRTPRSTYRALASVLRERAELDLSRLVIVMMDDYVVPDPDTGLLRRVPVELPYSCEGFGRREIFDAINAGRDDAGMPVANLWFPDASDPAAYDARIEASGGIDFFILATGKSDGHVAFNPPGSDISSHTRIVDLPLETRTDNLVTFPAFESIAEVPRQGVTVGLATIRTSRRAVMLLVGADKSAAASRLLAVDHYIPEWPSTIVHECADYDIYATSDVGVTAVTSSHG